jgi:methylmalonyl-CoA/ethylmalonyl-CoA epimerase
MLSVRPAEPRDAGEVLTVQRAAFVTEAQLHDDVQMAPLTQTLDEVRQAIATTAVLVAVDGARIVGSVRAYEVGRYWHIGRLVVVPDRQGEGIGSLLITEIERLAPPHLSAFSVETGPKSVRNVRLYERHGYAQAPNDTILIRLTKSRGDIVPSLFTKIDHVGIAVPDLDEAIAFYRDTFGIVTVHEETNEDQGVREAMLAVGDGATRIQLLAPVDADSTIAKFLDRLGPGVQQVACTVDDIEAVSATLRERGMRLLYDAPRRGTAGSRVNFVHPKDAGGVLIELVQPAPGAQ